MCALRKCRRPPAFHPCFTKRKTKAPRTHSRGSRANNPQKPSLSLIQGQAQKRREKTFSLSLSPVHSRVGSARTKETGGREKGKRHTNHELVWLRLHRHRRERACWARALVITTRRRRPRTRTIVVFFIIFFAEAASTKSRPSRRRCSRRRRRGCSSAAVAYP